MSNLLVGCSAVFIVSVIVAIAVAVKRRSSATRILLAGLLLLPATFCLFGFAATFEPTDAATQWTFRIGYAVAGVGLVLASLQLLIRQPSAAGSD